MLEIGDGAAKELLPEVSAGIRRMVNEQKLGQDLSAAHFLKALAFLRRQVKKRPETA